MVVCDKKGPRDPWEFPPGVMVLNNPGHTIAGETIIDHERTEEEMREVKVRRACRHLNA